MSPPRLLVLGGTRSGKSRFALARAHAIGGSDVTFIATARTGDPELDARIAGHRAHRPDGWRTIESGLDLPAAIATAPGADRPEAVLLVDCLTLWVSALVEAGTSVEAAWTELSRALDAVRARTIAVSDEVGHGVVPAFELGRRFRDELGWLNQRVAETADVVVLMIAGIPLTLKGDPERWATTDPERSEARQRDGHDHRDGHDVRDDRDDRDGRPEHHDR